MSTELDRESLTVLELAREAEQALPRDPERVRQRVLAAVGVAAAAAVASASTPAGASTLPPAAPSASVAAKLAGAGLFGGLKLVGLASVLLVAGAGAYVFAGSKTAERVEVVPAKVSPARVVAVAQAQPLRAPQVDEAPLTAPPVVSVDTLPVLERAQAAAPGSPDRASLIKGRTSEAAPTSKQREGTSAASDETGAIAGVRTGVGASTSTSASPGASAPAAADKTTQDAEPETDTAPQPATLREDLQLLSQAQRALNGGDAGRALTLTLQMRSGQLSAERTALQVLALCQLGRRDEAVQQAERFRSIAPHSPLLPRIDASCAKP
jgi:hypothetical protein